MSATRSDCPARARNRVPDSTAERGLGTVPTVNPLLEEAARRLQIMLGLSPERAARAVAEVLDSMRFDVDEYIRMRHAALQAENRTNAEIYDRIALELAELRFLGPKLSARQIRRRIYG
jgi:hypothetical protein